MKKSPLPLIALLTTLFSLPIFVYAADAAQGFNTLGGLVNTFTNTIVKSLATLFATAAMAAFFYGIVEYIWGFREGQQEVITRGQTFMGWSIIALFVMFSVWGIVKYAQGIFGISNQSTIVITSIQLGNGNNSDQNSGGPGMFQGTNNPGISAGGGTKSTKPISTSTSASAPTKVIDSDAQKITAKCGD